MSVVAGSRALQPADTAEVLALHTRLTQQEKRRSPGCP
jgi:hypothetical protein